MNNIKIFDLYSSFIFNELYKNFPKCISFTDIDKVILELEKDNSIQNLTQNLPLEEKKILFSETILWLTNNNFIDFVNSHPSTKRPAQPIAYSNFLCITLTIKGLNLLNSPKPTSLNKTKKLGEEIYEKIKQGSFLEAGKMVTDGMFEFIEKGLQ